jgi:hypothetical protein
MRGALSGGIWWLFKGAVRLATRLRHALGPAPRGTHPTAWLMGARLDVEEDPPRANLAPWLEVDSPERLERVRELVGVYTSTFCGECKAGPDAPELRCARCLERLVRVIDERNGGEVRKLAEIAELARTGRL